MKDTEREELFPVVDSEGNRIGTARRSVCHDGKTRPLHPVVHLHIFNSAGSLFLQKRAMTKDIQPGRWDTAVGGHIHPGEDLEEALLRESKEELGLTDFTPEHIIQYIWESDAERELVNSFSTTCDFIPAINREEIDDGRFWTPSEIGKSMGKGVFTPNLEHELRNILVLSPSGFEKLPKLP